MAVTAPNEKTSPDAIPRADARVKVTGQARDPSDVLVANPAFACLATSAIARGSIPAINVDAARAVPGVLDVLTFENANVLKPVRYSRRAAISGPRLFR